jgi:hypothetical protein
MSLNRVKGFRSKQIACWSQAKLAAGTAVCSDGLACFAAVRTACCNHSATVISGPGMTRRRQVLNWVDTMLGNVKNVTHGTYHAISTKHLPRCLAEFSYRFNRRYDLAGMLARMAITAAHPAYALSRRKVGPNRRITGTGDCASHESERLPMPSQGRACQCTPSHTGGPSDA